MHDENCGCDYHNEEGHMHHMCGSMKKEFKLAMLEKKEKMLKAELEFVEKMKEIVKKSKIEEKEESK